MSKPLTMASSGYQMSDQSCCDNVTSSGLPLKRIPRKKIHCILPSSPWLADSKTNVPLGVLYIAGLLREQGHEIVVTSMLDKRYEGNIHLPEEVMDSDVHMFGFCTPQFGEALELAAYIKDRNPEALLVAGGPHPSYEPRETKEAGRQEHYHIKGRLAERRDYRAQDGRQLFDTVIVMEGEVATLQMLTDWDAGKLQPYYYGDKADAMDLDAIPFPAWDLLPHDHIYNDGVAVMKRKYFPNAAHPDSSSAVMSLIGTRGCPYKCFAAGTSVRMADGTQKNIETIVVGDMVESFSIDTGRLDFQRVSMVGSRDVQDTYRVRLTDQTEFVVTGEHPFVTPVGWGFPRDFDTSTFVRRVRESGRAKSVTSEDNDYTKSPRNPTLQQNVFAGMQQRCNTLIKTGGSESGQASRNSSPDFSDGKVASSRTCCEVEGHTRFWQNALSWSFVRSKISVFRTHETEQSDASTRSRKAHGRDESASVSRWETAALSIAVRDWVNTRTCFISIFLRRWTANCTLWGSDILGRTLSIWPTPQSRYAAFNGAQSYSFQWPILAYTGRHCDTVTRLSERGLVSTSSLGRVRDQSSIGPCPSERIPGDWIRVESVTFLGRGRVYNISVEHNETFIAEDIAVHNCTYCSTPWIGQKPRYRSPHNIITEMALVMDKGVRMFKFQDDTYTLHKTKLRELALAVRSTFGPDSFAARIHTRVNTMDDHVAESLKLMNTRVTCFGIESGSQAVLDANWKGTKVQQNTDALINAKKHGFYTIAFLVTGMAGETLETMQETMEWLLSVKPYLDSCNLAVGIPYPGSRWWTHPQESGIDIIDYNYDNQWIVGFSARNEILVRPHGCTVDEMFKIKKEMFDFLVYHGWAKAEWDEDVRIRKQQEEAEANGTLTAASGLSYVGH